MAEVALQWIVACATMTSRFPGDRSASARQGTPNIGIDLVLIVNTQAAAREREASRHYVAMGL